MYISGLDAPNHTIHSGYRPVSTGVSSTSDERSYATAAEFVQQANSGPGSTNGAGDSNNSASHAMSSTRRVIPPPAPGSHNNGWPDQGVPSSGTRVEPRRPGAHPDLNVRPTRYIRNIEGRRQKHIPQDDDEAWGEIAEFLRTVTPPPTNYMSVPTEPYTPTTISSSSSIRRRASRKKKGRLTRCLLFLRGGSRHGKPARKPSVRGLSPIIRAASHKHKRPPRITLPDTAIAGRTVDGHRHIAISIPAEHDLLEPAPRYRFPGVKRRTTSMPSVERSPAFHNDVAGRPRSTNVDEPQVGMQPRPVAEERGSPSLRPREGDVQRRQEEVRVLRLPWRDTFGPPKEVSRSNAGPVPPSTIPRRINHGHDAPGLAKPSTPHTSDEVRDMARRKALAALSRPLSGHSAHSSRSFATASPASKASHPAVRNFSLHPGSVDVKIRRARSNSGQRGRNPHSRDSSRDDYTLQESIFSEPHFLESKGTLESASEVDRNVVTGPTQARRASGTLEASFEERGGSARESGQSGQSLGRIDPSADVQETRKGSCQETEKSSGQESKITATPVSVNPAMKMVEAHTVKPTQLRKSVQIVLETPAEDSSPDDTGENRGYEDDDGLRGVGDGANKGTESKGKGKEQTVEASSMLQVPGEDKENRRKGKEKLPSPLPSPEQREEMRKETLLLRRKKVARLRKALEDPGTQPKDLVWRRRPSDSSVGSSDEIHATGNGPSADRLTTPTHVPDASERNPDTLEATPARSGISTVMTVADVQPSSPLAASPELGITRKESLPLSASSLDTVATAVKITPMPPYQYIGHVTPPDSPPPSQTSLSPVSSVETPPQGTPLRHPPSRRLDSLPQRSSTFGHRSPVLPGRRSPVSQGTPGPNITSNDPLPSTIHSAQDPDENCIEADTSVLKMPRNDKVELHDTLLEEQARDMERRLQRLERNRDDWFSTMLPLLTDMTQALGKLASSEGDGEGKGKGRGFGPELDRQAGRPRSSNGDGRRNMKRRQEPAGEVAEPSTLPFITCDQDDMLDSDEVIRRHTRIPNNRSRAGTSTSEHSRRPHALGVDVADDERRARSSSLGERGKPRRRRAYITSDPPPALPAEAASLRGGRPPSGTARGPQVPALPHPMHPRDETEAEGERGGHHLEPTDKRVDARLRSLSLGAQAAGGLARHDGRREVGPDFYAATADHDKYNETLDGLMRRLPPRGHRPGTKSVDAADWHGVNRAPGAVVGFGAFST